MFRLFALCLLCGCSDYDFSSPTDVPAGTEDDGEAPVCTWEEPASYAPAPTAPCAADPVISDFEPVVEWHWDVNPADPAFTVVETTPAVANLTDDNNDGLIDANDVPDIVFTAYTERAWHGPGYVVALSGADGSTLWALNAADLGHTPLAVSGMLVADLEGAGDPSVFVATTDGLLCLTGEGDVRWFAAVSTMAGGWSLPAAGDVDGDGLSEIVLGGNLIDSEGNVVWTADDADGQRHTGAFPVDLDGDGLQEIVSGGVLFSYDGVRLWDDGTGLYGWTAVADLDGDGVPEIIKSEHRYRVVTYDLYGNQIWEFDLEDGDSGGPPTVADFDGDGQPEIGVASRYLYRVLEGDGSVLWSVETQEYSSGFTGSSVFDFEGDGAAEVVYADERVLWIFDGATGAVELEWDMHDSGTKLEYPVVADVDGDGATEIVVVHGRDNDDDPSRTGVSVIADANDTWMAARPVWNQHAYFISNVDDDAGIPANPAANWTKWNSFRAAHSESPLGLALPDLRTGEPAICTEICDADEVEMYLPAENGGARDAAAVSLAVYRLDGTSETLARELEVPALSAGGQVWLGPIVVSRSDFGSAGLLMRVDPSDAGGDGEVLECDEANNVHVVPSFPCD